MATTATELRIIGTPTVTWRQDKAILAKVRERTKHKYVAITTDEDGRAVGATADSVLNVLIPLLFGFKYHIYMFADDSSVRCVYVTRKVVPEKV